GLVFPRPAALTITSTRLPTILMPVLFPRDATQDSSNRPGVDVPEHVEIATEPAHELHADEAVCMGPERQGGFERIVAQQPSRVHLALHRFAGQAERRGAASLEVRWKLPDAPAGDEAHHLVA